MFRRHRIVEPDCPHIPVYRDRWYKRAGRRIGDAAGFIADLLDGWV